MDRISKPHLVDFLRLSDRKHWLHPRIRYASIRSKPQLLADLRKFFRTRHVKHRSHLLFVPLRVLPAVPRIEYCFAKKQFLFDGNPIDVPKRSKARVPFRILREPVTLTFPQIVGSPPEQEAVTSTQRGAEPYARSQTPDTDSLPNCSEPSSPFGCSERTPNKEPYDPPAWGTRIPAGSPRTAYFSYL